MSILPACLVFPPNRSHSPTAKEQHLSALVIYWLLLVHFTHTNRERVHSSNNLTENEEQTTDDLFLNGRNSSLRLQLTAEILHSGCKFLSLRYALVCFLRSLREQGVAHPEGRWQHPLPAFSTPRFTPIDIAHKDTRARIRISFMEARQFVSLRTSSTSERFKRELNMHVDEAAERER